MQKVKLEHSNSLNNYTNVFSSCMELENLNDCQSNLGIIPALFSGTPHSHSGVRRRHDDDTFCLFKCT